MKRFRKGDMYRPPTAAESAASADALEGFRRRPPVPQDLAPVGQIIIVKTPEAGIDARVGTTISSAVCTRVIEIDSSSNEKTLVETDEELRIYNLETAAVAGEVYVTTGITLHGTRYVIVPKGVHIGKLDAALDFDDATGVTVSIWTGKPASDSGDNIDNVVASELLTPSGTFASGSPVKIEFIDGLWQVMGAPC